MLVYITIFFLFAPHAQSAVSIIVRVTVRTANLFKNFFIYSSFCVRISVSISAFLNTYPKNIFLYAQKYTLCSQKRVKKSDLNLTHAIILPLTRWFVNSIFSFFQKISQILNTFHRECKNEQKFNIFCRLLINALFCDIMFHIYFE